MHRCGGSLEAPVGQVLHEQPRKRRGRAQGVLRAHGCQHAAHGTEREHRTSTQVLPQLGQALQRLCPGSVPGDVGGVERTRRRTHDQVRMDVALTQRLHHPDLDRGQTPARGEHEGDGHSDPPHAFKTLTLASESLCFL
jgi:hypothetical protein